MIVPAPTVWAEVPAAEVGMDQRLVEAAAACAEDRLARHPGAAGQLVVLRRGRVVLDRTFGSLARDLFLVYSVSKAYTAMLVLLLAEKGLLSLDGPVADHWPEFAGDGRELITPRHVLQHRSGLAVDRSPLMLLALPDWEASVRRVATLTPWERPPTAPRYHALTFGFILGELARRVTGVMPDVLLRTGFLDPLGLRDTHLGVPDEASGRCVPVVAAGGRSERANALLFNRRAIRRAVVPAATVSAPARDVALFFEMLRGGGELGGVRVIAPDTVAETVRVSSDGEVDGVIGMPVRWGQGFHLGGVRGPRDLARCMGLESGLDTFGHGGNCCCIAWVDPGRELTFVYLTNLLLSCAEGIDHHGLVSDCVLAACAPRPAAGRRRLRG